MSHANQFAILDRTFWVFYKNFIREAYTNQTEVIKYNALDSYTNDILLKGLRKFCHSLEIIYDSYYMIHLISYDLYLFFEGIQDRLIEADRSKPLFTFLSMQAVHTPIQVRI